MGVGGIKAVRIGALVFGLFSKGNAIVEDNLLDGVGLSRRAGLVAPHVVTGNKDTIAGDDLTGLKEGNIANEQVLDVDDALDSGPNNFDTTFFLLIVKNAELSFLLPIIEGTDHYLWDLN